MIQRLGFTGIDAKITPQKISVTKDDSGKPATQANSGDIIKSDAGDFLVLEKNNGIRLVTPFEAITINDDELIQTNAVIGGSLKLIG